MPELPEVETICQDLSRLIVGKKILSIETDSPKQVQPSPGVVKKAAVGTTIKKVARRAKLLQIFLSNGKILTVHLKLTGRLLVREKDASADDWQRVAISLSGDKELRFCDLRKFGWMRLVESEKELEELLAEFGPEPLDDLTLEKFEEVLARSGRPVKIILMDQQRISGIGNIYANEALFLAGIDPRRPADKINGPGAKKLFDAIEKVLRAGVRYRGASDQYYLDALGHKGTYQEHFLVYGRQGQKCPHCQDLIKKIFIGGRGTFYCPFCQK